jgi:small subunit ribosomal protein S6
MRPMLQSPAQLLATPCAGSPGVRAQGRGRLSPREGDTGALNDYEILLMLDPDVPEDRHAEILARTRELVERDGGAWESQDAWGRRRLAYEIDHKTEGVYHLLTFSCEPAALDEVSRVLKITDGVMRHMATRRPRPHRRTAATPPAESAPAQTEPAQAETPEYAGEAAADTDGAPGAEGEE